MVGNAFGLLDSVKTPEYKVAVQVNDPPAQSIPLMKTFTIKVLPIYHPVLLNLK